MSLFVWYLQGLLTPVIAIIAVYIAWQQASTNELRQKLDLFDRRYQTLNEVRKLLSLAVGKGDLAIEEVRQFMAETLPAEFLFGPEVKEYIGEVYSHGLSLWTAKEELRGIFEGGTAPGSLNRQAVAEKIATEVKWLAAQLPVTADKFKKYLDMSNL